ncbi:MAG: hypothetical protein ACD_79C01204G0002 [uncultured bacterium]|nr:MAG: hypothetical protein ACD_79C01204G0002 [uncultured bacterium]
MVLEISNLTCGYSANNMILHNVSLCIKNGDFTGIIGPNGSGKSTLFKTITRLLSFKTGKIILDDEDITKISLKEFAKKIAVVTQNAITPERMTVHEYLYLGRIPHRDKFQFFDRLSDHETINTIMNETDIMHLKDRYISNLSGGEKQLVVIARALCQEPLILLLDEPTNHLDIAHKAKVLDFLKRLNKQKKLTVIIILHDLNLASEYCQRLILLNNGKVYKTGVPDEVLKYEYIEEVYGTTVVVRNNPMSNKPFVFIVSEELKSRVKHE